MSKEPDEFSAQFIFHLFFKKPYYSKHTNTRKNLFSKYKKRLIDLEDVQHSPSLAHFLKAPSIPLTTTFYISPSVLGTQPKRIESIIPLCTAPSIILPAFLWFEEALRLTGTICTKDASITKSEIVIRPTDKLSWDEIHVLSLQLLRSCRH